MTMQPRTLFSKTLWAVLVGSALVLPAQAVSAGAYDDLLAAAQAEVEAKGGKLVIALDWPDSDALPVMEAFKEDFPFVTEIEYTRETGIDPFGRYLLELQQGVAPPYDIMHIASEFEQQYWDAGAFIEPLFSYDEVNDSLPADWPKINAASMDPEGNFLATTGNARGIAWNPNLVPEGEEPRTWADCVDPKWKGKVIYDSRNKLQAFQYDEQERARHMDWLQQLAANDVVLVRGQSNVLTKVASGEFPVTCGINYHTSYRMIERDGVTTLKFALAETIPLELATRLFIPKWSETPATAQLFALWATTAGQGALGKHAYRGFPWNERAHKFEASQGKYVSVCGGECALNFEDYNAEHSEIIGLPTVEN